MAMVKRTLEAVDRALAACAERVQAEPALRAEFEHTRPLFGGDETDGGGAPAVRRHLEWFVLERPSEALGGVPVEALREAWSGVEEAPVGLDEALLESRAGAFEVTAVEEARGLWMRDLFGHGEYPVAEPDAAAGLRKGDLLVGRIFPVGDGVFGLSLAVSCFRDAALLSALRADAERLREGRRGSLRIEQLELERLFFGGGPPGSRPPDRGQGLARTRGRLARAGLSPEQVEGVVGELTAAARSSAPGNTVTEALNRLAFETEVDLDLAREALVDLWAVLNAVDEPGADPERARAALAAFDRATAEGRDLGERFRVLEEELGIDAGGSDTDDDLPAPDFPGVVGAMVQEFLWDVGREEGPERVEALGVLRLLGEYAAPLGVFENLGRDHLLDFAGRWLLDEADVREEAHARALLDALEAFCRWSEERHAHPLWSAFGDALESLREAVPRLVEVRPALPGPEPGSDSAQAAPIEAVEPSGLRLRGPEGHPRTVPVDEPVASRLRPGDLVVLDAAGQRPVAIYPAVLAQRPAAGTASPPAGGRLNGRRPTEPGPR